jgi:Ras-related protein Rab-1A
MPSLYRGAHGMLLVYDVTQESSFLGLPEWKSEVDSLTHSQLRAILIGNKCDQVRARSYLSRPLSTSLALSHLSLPPRSQIQDKVVTTVRAEELADKLGVAMFETSAAHNVNVTEAFISLARDVLRSVEIRARSPRGDEAERVRLAAKAPPPAAKRKCRC